MRYICSMFNVKVSTKSSNNCWKFSWLLFFSKGVNLRINDNAISLHVEFFFQPIYYWIYCIINCLKSWILIVDLSLIVTSLVHVYTHNACLLIRWWIYIFCFATHVLELLLVYLKALWTISGDLQNLIISLSKGEKRYKTCMFSASFQKGEKFCVDFLALQWFFYHLFVFIFSNNKTTTFWSVYQCVHQGGDYEIKVCLIVILWWTIDMRDNWF